MNEGVIITTEAFSTRLQQKLLEWREIGIGVLLALLLHAALLGIELPPQPVSSPQLSSQGVVSVVLLSQEARQVAEQATPLERVAETTTAQPPEMSPTAIAPRQPAAPAIERLTTTTPAAASLPAAVEVVEPGAIQPQIPLPQQAAAANEPLEATTAISASDSATAYHPPSSQVQGWRNPEPRYPGLAKRRGMEGMVELLIKVDEQGVPLQIIVSNSSGYSVLDKAAETAVWQWRFTPAMQGDQAVSGEVRVPIRFVLEA